MEITGLHSVWVIKLSKTVQIFFQEFLPNWNISILLFFYSVTNTVGDPFILIFAYLLG